MQKYQNLKKSRKQSDIQAAIFQDSLGDLFAIRATEDLGQMTMEGDQAFYQVQRKDGTSCSMSSHDLATVGRESRKRLWEEQDKARRAKAEAKAASSSVVEAQLSSRSSSSFESQDDKDFAPTPGCLTVIAASPKRMKNIFASPAVASALDGVN